jgi:hypothetical protein
MRSARIGEWILSLVTTSERAAATVGDLLENGVSVVWFWASILSTMAALLWRDVVSDPRRMTRLAVIGYLYQFLLLAAAFLLLAVALVIGVLVAGALGVIDAQHPPAIQNWSIAGPLSWVLAMIVQFVVGRWLAKRSPGQELAPCLMQVILGYIVAAVVWFVWGGTLGVGHSILDIPLFVLVDVPLWAGAITVRRARFHS